MSASDIPEPGHLGAWDMARKLVTYIACPKRVRQAVSHEYGPRAPTETTIRQMREDYLRSQQRPAERPYTAHEGYYPADAARRLDATNTVFLRRLAAERARSAAANQDFVNPAWRRSA